MQPNKYPSENQPDRYPVTTNSHIPYERQYPASTNPNTPYEDRHPATTTSSHSSLGDRHQYDERICPIPNTINKRDFKLPSLSETLPEFFPQAHNNMHRRYSIDIERHITSPLYHNNALKFNSQFTIENQEKKPRPRRRYDEVERLYSCIYPGCNKAYGALNHLNSHIVTKGHGKKRLPAEFEEMRRRLKQQLMEYENDKANFIDQMPYYKP